MIVTKRIWAAKPLLVAYVVAVGFTVGLLVNRNPVGADQAVPAVASGESDQHGVSEREVKEPPLWLQLFRPSLRTARMMLRMGLPVLTAADGSAREEEPQLLVYWTGKGGQQPQTLFQSALPFMRPEDVAGRGPDPAKPGPGPGPGPKPGPGSQEQPPPDTPPEPKPDTPPKDEPTPEPQGPKPYNNGLPVVGIYHTHDWESFVSEFALLSLQRREDLNKLFSNDHSKRTVVHLGDVMAQRLWDLGIGTVHAPFKHQDLPYDYSYQLSRDTAKRILKEAPTVKVLLDIHRDAAWGTNHLVKIDGKQVSQVRCIIGTREQPKWQQNKAFCEVLRTYANKRYPGLMLETREQKDTYNQDLMVGAILLEVGDAQHRYEEAERAARYLSEALADLIRDGKYPK